jgi:ankyrin repeat protein
VETDEFLEMVEFLISLGADVNVRDNDGNTPLHIAICNQWDDEYIEPVEFLVSKGADVNVKNNERKTPLDYAVENVSYKTIALLRQHDDFHALHRAVECGNIELVKKLVSEGNDIEAKDRCHHDMTPLHCAAHKENKEIVEFLLSQGANVNAKGEDGWTSLHWASTVEVAQCLITAGADFNAEEDEYGCTPLELAAKNGDMEMVQFLISQGAIEKAKDYGVGAVSWAIATEEFDIARFLISELVNVDDDKIFDILDNIIIKFGDYVDDDYELAALLLQRVDYLSETMAYGLLTKVAYWGDIYGEIKMTNLVLKYVEDYLNCGQVQSVLKKYFSKVKWQEQKHRKKKKRGYTLLLGNLESWNAYVDYDDDYDWYTDITIIGSHYER